MNRPRPRARCQACGEYLPHYCAPAITRNRLRSGRRVITITDRQPAAAYEPVPGSWWYVLVTGDAQFEWDGQPPYQVRREYLDAL